MISHISVALAAAVFLVSLWMLWEFMLASRRLKSLDAVTPLPASELPRLSIVVPARDEERNLERAMRSLFAQDYPDFEIIAVNDRSTDSTGSILEAVRRDHPGLRIIEITQLPAGWLGKNNALQTGAAVARGSVLLFADADVLLHPQAARKAVSRLLQSGAHHLTVTPVLHSRSFWLEVAVAGFSFMFSLACRPWRVSNPRSRAHIGIGAFNMVRRDAYWAMGGHNRIRLRPDDDLKLGKLVKLHGFRQEVLLGSGMVGVEWYRGVREMIRGLRKNAFAGAEYNVFYALAACAGMAAIFVLPLVGVIAAGGLAQILFGLATLIILALACAFSAVGGFRWWSALGLPYAAGILIIAILGSVLSVLRHGGITWRGTFYSLKELKQNKV